MCRRILFTLAAIAVVIIPCVLLVFAINRSMTDGSPNLASIVGLVLLFLLGICAAGVLGGLAMCDTRIAKITGGSFRHDGTFEQMSIKKVRRVLSCMSDEEFDRVLVSEFPEFDDDPGAGV